MADQSTLVSATHPQQAPPIYQPKSRKVPCSAHGLLLCSTAKLQPCAETAAAAEPSVQTMDRPQQIFSKSATLVATHQRSILCFVFFGH